MKPHIDTVIQLTGIMLCVVAAIVLLGYKVNKTSLYTWHGDVTDVAVTAMAPPTAICFLAIGVSLFLIGRRK